MSGGQYSLGNIVRGDNIYYVIGIFKRKLYNIIPVNISGYTVVVFVAVCLLLKPDI